MTSTDADTTSATGHGVELRSSFRSRLAFVLRVAWVRLRFILVLAAIFSVLASWGYLTSVWDWTMAKLGPRDMHGAGVSPDTEYFCPMCPGVLSHWPQKCPVCKMPLVRRRIGDAKLLPEGVVARMQISPYRLQLAGIRTGPVRYEPVRREWTTVGRVELDPQRISPIVAAVNGTVRSIQNDLLWRHVDQGELLVTLESASSARESPNANDDPPPVTNTKTEARTTRNGYVTRFAVRAGQEVAEGDVLAEVADLDVVRVICDVPQADIHLVQIGQTVRLSPSDAGPSMELRGVVEAIQPMADSSRGPIGVRIVADVTENSLIPGLTAEVKWSVPLANVEPYRSMPRNPSPLAPSDLREVYVCDDHTSYVHTRAGKCPFHDQALQPHALLENQRIEWRCPVHPQSTARHSGDCDQCDGLPLVASIVTYLPEGQVLTVPESAVIDTGSSQWVFVESAPGMFDAVPVRVGLRCRDVYPVLEGLEAGQLVALSGAFLLDAETRLTPGVAASYFGAGSRIGVSADGESRLTKNDAAGEGGETWDLPAADIVRIRRQKTCPVTKLPLGSMGKPIRVRAGEHVVYLCCAGCKSRVRGASATVGAESP